MATQRSPRRSHGYDFYVVQEMCWRRLAAERPSDHQSLIALHQQLIELEDQLLRFHCASDSLGFNCAFRFHRARVLGLKLPPPVWSKLPGLAKELGIVSPGEYGGVE